MFYKLRIFLSFFSFFSLNLLASDFDIPDDIMDDYLPAPIRWVDDVVEKTRQLPSDVYDAACRNPKATAAIIGVAAATVAAVSNERSLLKAEGAGPGDMPGLFAVFRSSGPRAVFSGLLVGSGAGAFAKNEQLAAEVRETGRLSIAQEGAVRRLEGIAEKVEEGVGNAQKCADDLATKVVSAATSAKSLRVSAAEVRKVGLGGDKAIRDIERVLAERLIEAYKSRVLTEAEMEWLTRSGDTTAKLNVVAEETAKRNTDLLSSLLEGSSSTDGSNPQDNG